ncbi:KilA-N domain-containing protein [Segatella oris]|uniref:KilA-N domain protein n=1 Tax=Segatella oris C735 TaxID=563008 RepID=D7NDQ3_9BACT|nr:KilA-N domain-containing protein [Segatella oris]EFI48421.1 KilA-N domain protein [Segatella oris C735]
MVAKFSILKVKGIDIAMTKVNESDFISLTDMIKAKDGDFFISDWLRNRNTLEYLAAWESLNNPSFNYGEFAIIKDKSGLNNFKISVKEWVARTGAIGLTAKTGRYGGTYAHTDIAFNFGMWISPIFQLYIVKEYQRLKEIESNQYNLEWNVKRLLSKANYRIHTDAIDKYMIPKLSFSQRKEWVYSDEADLLNIVMFGCTAKQWREANPKRALKGENLRDIASINDLAILSNLETLNAMLIKHGLPKKERARILIETAKEQKKVLDSINFMNSIKKVNDATFLDAQKFLDTKNGEKE